MMHVVEYLRELNFPPVSSFLRLEEEHKIIVKIYYDLGLVLLNYSQIDSDKRNSVVQECRSLVLDMEFNVVSRGFDRFFNYEEIPPEEPVTELIAYEKIDGSLVTIFFWRGSWLYRTRGVIMPEHNVQGYDVTWTELVEETIFSRGIEEFYEGISYIFELTTPENRIVVKHNERKSYFLAARNKSGVYVSFSGKNWPRPRQFTFKSYEDCKRATEELPNLEEGYVMYNKDGAPVSKIKNPAYVAAHHLKGEGFSKRRVMDLVMSGEVDEYLAIFPEDTDFFRSFRAAWDKVAFEVGELWAKTQDIEVQKDFAFAVKESPVRSILFRMRRGQNFDQVLDSMTQPAKYNMFGRYLELSAAQKDKLIDE